MWGIRTHLATVSLCGYYLTLETYIALHVNKFEFSSLPKNTPLCQVKWKLTQLFFRRWFSKFIHVCIFLLCCFYLPLEKGQNPSFDVKLILFTTKMFCAKLGWNWPSGFRVEDFQKLSLFFHFVAFISSSKKG